MDQMTDYKRKRSIVQLRLYIFISLYFLRRWHSCVQVQSYEKSLNKEASGSHCNSSFIWHFGSLMSPQIKHNGIKFTLKLFLKTFVSQMQHKLWHLWCILHMQYYVINLFQELCVHCTMNLLLCNYVWTRIFVALSILGNVSHPPRPYVGITGTDRSKLNVIFPSLTG